MVIITVLGFVTFTQSQDGTVGIHLLGVDDQPMKSFPVIDLTVTKRTVVDVPVGIVLDQLRIGD